MMAERTRPDVDKRSAVARFFAALRQIDTEYGRADISASAAMAEVRAALRQLDRNQGRIQKGEYHGKAPV
jgi:hypothetical protein